ncbi:MAG: insulinase family protein [Candidatus Marinimicrobia bacterium]|nr:insulinase family protein [Candidatus Neomarinimicrobiota bacterium]
MKKRYFGVLLSVILLFIASCMTVSVEPKEEIEKPKRPSLFQAEKLPFDPKVKIGSLDNGLTYILRQNIKPENRLSLRLVVKAGSIDEDENQRGLAHLCEHMAFNGTRHFEKDALVNYLESIGMEFGAELNAYTSFDETVYMLNLPTDSTEILEKGFQVLDDWASNVSYENEEIDKERGVVHEEWRSGRGAGQRVRDQFLPVLFHGSKYGERLPIGLMDVVDNCTYETLKKFYNDWYRPDLQAVVVVGDLPVEKMEELVKKYFSDNQNPPESRPRKLEEVPDQADTKYVIATDSEMNRTTIYIYFKHEIEDKSTVDWYRKNLAKTLYSSMLNNRYNELIQKANPPFIGAFAGESDFIRSKRFYSVAALAEETGIETAFTTLLTEVKRVEAHGFLESELERTKAEILKNFKHAYTEREKTPSDRFTDEYTDYFLNGDPAPGIEWSWEFVQKILPAISLKEVNQLTQELISDDNRVIIITGPEKEGLIYPDEIKLADLTEAVNNHEIEAYTENIDDSPLVSGVVRPGMTVEKKTIEAVKVNFLKLSNGIKIYYKVTDFQKDEIRMSAFSPGGHSLSSDEDFISASYAASIIDLSGLGDFDNIALQKKLSGKRVAASPYIGELREGFTGSCSVTDLETLLQLVHLYFTKPRKDETAFQSTLSRQLALLENRKANPMSALQDTLTTTLTQNHFRSRPMTPEILKSELNLDKSFSFYRERFADADDFTFFFVGNINPELFETLCMKYLGSLPSLPRVDEWKNTGVEYPQGLVEKELKAGVDPKSNVVLVYNGQSEWNYINQKKLEVVKDVLNIMLREKIREDESGTYGVRCQANFQRIPESEHQIMIYFGCDPQRAELLTTLLLAEIEKLISTGPTLENLDKVKAAEQRNFEKNLKENGFWLGKLNFYIYNGLNINEIPSEIEITNSFTVDDIQQAAQQYFGNNLIKILQFPAE